MFFVTRTTPTSWHKLQHKTHPYIPHLPHLAEHLLHLLFSPKTQETCLGAFFVVSALPLQASNINDMLFRHVFGGQCLS